MHRRDR
ncbi:hypothetical protein E2C01_101306 [Portunus trituberculatus]|nr:hypothetical protein [Portunus trituberculatus]